MRVLIVEDDAGIAGGLVAMLKGSGYAVDHCATLAHAWAAARAGSQVTVFDSVGFALEDFSALRFMHQTAERLGLGERIALIPQLADPKNLFGMLAAPVCLSARLEQIAAAAPA